MDKEERAQCSILFDLLMRYSITITVKELMHTYFDSWPVLKIAL